MKTLDQIPAQDCELEYWLQQAENYVAPQIPADDLRAIIARAYLRVPPTRNDGIEAVAAMLDKKAADYFKDYGYHEPEMGNISFGRGRHAEAKLEYYDNLVELAEEVRAMRGAAAIPSPPPTDEEAKVERVARAMCATSRPLSNPDKMQPKPRGQVGLEPMWNMYAAMARAAIAAMREG